MEASSQGEETASTRRPLLWPRESVHSERLRALQTETDAGATALRSSVAAMKKELAEARETTQSLQLALKETRERADAAQAKAARAGSLQGKSEEQALALQKARFLQEETELKLARASDERDRARQAQSVNEKGARSALHSLM